MIEQIVGWGVLVLTLVALSLVVIVLQGFRSTSNKLLALASREFHEASDSLMETASELPDSVLSTLKTLNKSAFARGTPWLLYRSLKFAKKSDRAPVRSAFDDLSSLRPELRNLFGTALASWLNILTHRNLVLHFLIANEMTRVQVSSGVVAKGLNNEQSFKSLIPALRHVDC